MTPTIIVQRATSIPIATPTRSTPPGTPTQEITRIGGSITGVGSESSERPGFQMTIDSWEESNIAVEGPYSGNDWYTFTAKPDMKFVVLRYRLTNTGLREQTTPYFDSGEVLTTPKGYFYSVWHSPLGVYSVDYQPRRATAEETSLLGHSGAFEKLLQEQTTTGRVLFEVPKDFAPASVRLARVRAQIVLRDAQ